MSFLINSDQIIYYKSVRFIDGKLKSVITDESGNIIQNPTKQQTKLAIFDNRKGPKHKNYICCTCRNDVTYIDPSGYERWYNHICDKSDCTGHTCHNCYMRYNPNSSLNTIKSLANSRIGNISIYSHSGKGLIAEAIVAKVRGIKNANIDNDNFHVKFDLYSDHKYGTLQVTSCTLMNYNQWKFGGRDFPEKIANSDNVFIVCGDFHNPWKDVERIYVIPSEEIIHLTGLTIYKNNIRKDKYKEFKLDDINQYNDSYHNLISYLNGKEFFGIGDIKEWTIV